jgi:SAM-dependent methyltransferase
MEWAAVCAGSTPRDLLGAFRYLDLGCGDGSILCLLADCYPKASFVGVDINGDHIALGRERAARAELDNVSFHEASFADLDSLGLPTFDYIAAAGVYSWISSSLRQEINAFAQHRLNPSGLFAVQYSCLPGAAVSDPLARILTMLSEKHGRDGLERFKLGLEDLKKLAPVSRYFKDNPQSIEIVRYLESEPVDAKAHDVLNRQPHSFHFSEVCEPMIGLGFEFLGSAGLNSNYPELAMSKSAFAIYRELTTGADVVLREATKDLILNTMKRFDLFRQTEPTRTGEPQTGGLAAVRNIYLRRARGAADLEARRRISETCAVDLTGQVYSAVLDLAEGHGVSVAKILERDALDAFPKREVEEAIERLVVKGFLSLMIKPGIPANYHNDARYRLTSQLNANHLAESALNPGSEELASPVLGAPLSMPQVERLGLLAATGGDLDRVWDAIGNQQQLKLADTSGKPVTSKEQFLALIERGLPQFAAQVIPQLQMYGIVEEQESG